MKCKIARAINNITINGNEYVLDENNKVIEFKTIKQAKKYLKEKGVKSFKGIYFETLNNMWDGK